MKALVVGETPAISTRLGECLSRFGIACAARPLTDAGVFVPSPHGGPQPDITFVAINRMFPPHYEMITRLRASIAGVIVVASTIPHHGAVLQAIRAGADDFVDLTGDLEGELQHLVERIKRQSVTRHTVHQLITVLPCGDWSDANILASNLAAAVARRTGGCTLLDFHLNGGDQAALFGLSPRHTIADLMASKAEVDQAMLDQALVSHTSGVRVLAGARLFSKYVFSPAHAQRIVALSRSTDNAVVVNASDISQADETKVLATSDYLVLATRLDLISLSRTAQCVAHLATCGVATPTLRVVALNTGRRAEIPAREAQRVLGAATLECISDDPVESLISVNVGDPIVLRDPKTAMARSIDKLAGSLLGSAAAEATAGRRLVLSLFGRDKSSPKAPQPTTAQPLS